VCIIWARASVDPALAGLALANGLVLMQAPSALPSIHMFSWRGLLQDLRFAVRHATDVEVQPHA
jgi:hypothetical protein